MIDKNGYLSVTIFFALSAFLLYYPWAKPEKKRELGAYYVRRFWRIMPAYLAALTFAIPVALLVGKPVVAGDVISHIFMVHTWHPVWEGTLITPAWSLPAEMQFYLLLPLLALAFTGRSVFWLLGGVALAGAIQFFSDLIPYSQWVLWNNWPCLALPFMFGMVAAWVAAHNENRSWLQSLAPVGLWVMLFFASAFALTNGHWQYMGGWSELFLNARGVLMSLAAALTIIGLASGEGGWFSRALSWRPLRALGVCGYGIFLAHYPIYLLLKHFGGGWSIWILGLPLAIAAGVCSFLFIEAPLMRRSRKSHLFASMAK
jgi:peptidoglycan/LPS O-acetylase OafA/YrhL